MWGLKTVLKNKKLWEIWGFWRASETGDFGKERQRRLMIKIELIAQLLDHNWVEPKRNGVKCRWVKSELKIEGHVTFSLEVKQVE